MKQIIALLIFLCVSTVVCAQNPTEAKMAYQMAEEKLDAKQYTEALDYLEKAETALGSTNPPMLFLKVMITNQIVTAKESTDNYRKLEKAIADFDKHKDKNALGEDKLMEVYRIKMDLDKRKTAYEKEAVLKKQYEEMMCHLAAEFPKTEVSIKSFLQSIPNAWAKPLSKEERKQRKKEKKKILDIGDFYYGDIERKQLLSRTLFLKGELVDFYSAQQLLNGKDEGKHNRKVTVEEVCALLGISEQTWHDFTSGDTPYIELRKNVSGDSSFDLSYGVSKKRLSLGIEALTKSTGYGDVIHILIYENTLLND